MGVRYDYHFKEDGRVELIRNVSADKSSFHLLPVSLGVYDNQKEAQAAEEEDRAQRAADE